MAVFVLVPGACHGGWCFEPLARELRQSGHEAYPITLTGVGDRSHLLAASVNLDTHIQDVVSVLEAEKLERAVLCGHSYAGMVISGVADRVPERVGALVYIDAFVPGNGDSAWSLTNDEQRRWYLEGSRASGHALAPLPFFDPRATSHPLASLVQAIRLTGAVDKVQRKQYVYLSEWPGSPFAPVYERLLRDPAWTVHSLKSGHNVMRDAPDDLRRLVLEAAAGL